MNRDDRIHGALLILNELVRISSMEGEVRTASGEPRLLCLSVSRQGRPLSSPATDRTISSSSKSCENYEAGSKTVGLGLGG